MSAPAEKARSPAPVTTMARTSSSCLRSAKTPNNSRRMGLFCALSTSGRLSVIVTTWSCRSTRIVS